MAQQIKITQTSNADTNIGIPDKPFHIGSLREITDLHDFGEISYSRMVEMLNEVAIEWHNLQLKAEVDKVHEYYKRRR